MPGQKTYDDTIHEKIDRIEKKIDKLAADHKRQQEEATRFGRRRY